MQRLTLRQELVGSILAVLIPSTALMFVWYPARQEAMALAGARDRAVEMVELVAVGVGQAIARGDSADVRAAVDRAIENPALVYIVVADTAGRPLVRYDPLRLSPAIPSALTASRVDLESAWLRAWAPARYENRIVGGVHLGLSSEVLAEITNDRIMTALAGVVILALGVGAALYFAGRIAAPIVALRHAADEIARGNYAPELPAGGSQETRALSAAFSAMASEIRESTASMAGRRPIS
jgi:HAMP domain-containing protein